MVKISKTQLPDGVILNSADDWQRGTPAYNQLWNDCHGKCYICEDNSSELNVEHIKPRSKYSTKEYALGWDNLLLACNQHCNTLKGNGFEHMIDPAAVDPETKITLSMELGKVLVEPLDSDTDTQETAALLRRVYNADGLSANWRVKCSKLRGKVDANLKEFLIYAENAEDDTYSELIRREIDRSSAFAAFKRKIVRDDPALYSQFADALV